MICLPVCVVLNSHDGSCGCFSDIPDPDLAIISSSRNLERPVGVVVQTTDQSWLRILDGECWL